MGRVVTAPTHALLRTHRGRLDTGTRQHIAVADTGLTIHVVQGSEWHTGQALCGQPTLHVELVPLADLPPEPMLWCPTCLGRYIVALGCADVVLREAAA